jgi:hypothetical protein
MASEPEAVYIGERVPLVWRIVAAAIALPATAIFLDTATYALFGVSAIRAEYPGGVLLALLASLVLAWFRWHCVFGRECTVLYDRESRRLTFVRRGFLFRMTVTHVACSDIASVNVRYVRAGFTGSAWEVTLAIARGRRPWLTPFWQFVAEADARELAKRLSAKIATSDEREGPHDP